MMPAVTTGQPPIQTVYITSVPYNAQWNKTEYSSKHQRAVKGLTITQLVLSCIVTISQLITYLIDRYEHYYYNRTVDHLGTGLWIGAIMIITASVGFEGCKQNKKALIITHLVFNAILIPLCLVLVSMTAVSVSWLSSSCRYYEGCSSGLQGFWYAAEVILLIAAILQFIFAIILLVYNSVAACSCCRKTLPPLATVMYQPATGAVIQGPLAYGNFHAPMYQYVAQQGFVYPPHGVPPATAPLDATAPPVPGYTALTVSHPANLPDYSTLDRKYMPPQYAEVGGSGNEGHQ